jgi:hypothetical protein
MTGSRQLQNFWLIVKDLFKEGCMTSPNSNRNDFPKQSSSEQRAAKSE